MQSLQVLLLVRARQAMHAYARQHSQSLQETISALLISVVGAIQQNVHRTRITRHQLHQVGAQMCLLQLQIVAERRGGQRQVVGRIQLLQSAQRQVTPAQVRLARTAPEHNSRIGGILQSRGARNRQIARGRQGEGTLLLLQCRLMSLLRRGTVLRPTAKEMQKHQQRRRRRHQQKEPHTGHQRNNQTDHNRQAHAQQNLLELTRRGRVHHHRLKGVAGVAQGSERLRGLARGRTGGRARGRAGGSGSARLLGGVFAVGAG